MAQPEGTHRKVVVRDLLAETMVAVGARPEEAHRLTEAVLGRITAPDVIDSLYSDISEAIGWAFQAWTIDDETYPKPSHKTLGRVSANAVSAAFTADSDLSNHAGDDLTREQVQSCLDTIDYKGWNFIAQPMPDGQIGIAVRATVQDAHYPDKEFTTTRAVPIRGSILESAFDAVLVVERHEARERFKADGKLVFDPHAEDFNPQGIVVTNAEIAVGG